MDLMTEDEKKAYLKGARAALHLVESVRAIAGEKDLTVVHDILNELEKQ
jgi:hypothetical protein